MFYFADEKKQPQNKYITNSPDLVKLICKLKNRKSTNKFLCQFPIKIIISKPLKNFLSPQTITAPLSMLLPKMMQFQMQKECMQCTEARLYRLSPKQLSACTFRSQRELKKIWPESLVVYLEVISLL